MKYYGRIIYSNGVVGYDKSEDMELNASSAAEAFQKLSKIGAEGLYHYILQNQVKSNEIVRERYFQGYNYICGLITKEEWNRRVQ